MSTNTITTEDITTAAVAVSVERAESLTAAIRTAGEDYVNGRAALLSAVREAYDANVWEVLGFKTWTAYVTDVFKAAHLPKFSPADRAFIVGSVLTMTAEDGTVPSSRGLAAMLNLSQSTASRALAGWKAANGAEDIVVTGEDGKAYALARKTVKVSTDADGEGESDDSGEGVGEGADSNAHAHIFKAIGRLEVARTALCDTDTADIATADDMRKARARMAVILSDLRKYSDDLERMEKHARDGE